MWPLPAIGDAIQFASASEGADKGPALHLLVDICASEFSDWTSGAGLSYLRMFFVIVIVVAAVPGSTQSSALRAIELYQGFVRTFQR